MPPTLLHVDTDGILSARADLLEAADCCVRPATSGTTPVPVVRVRFGGRPADQALHLAAARSGQMLAAARQLAEACREVAGALGASATCFDNAESACTLKG